MPTAMGNQNNGCFVCNIVKDRKIKQRVLQILTLSNGGKVRIHHASWDSVLQILTLSNGGKVRIHHASWDSVLSQCFRPCSWVL
jgi:hypothetical protein